MAPSSANGVPDRDRDGSSTEPRPGDPSPGKPVSAEQVPGESAPGPADQASSSGGAVPRPGSELSSEQLLERLAADRLWLLQQIDGGHWSDLRLDLAALERELGQVLEQASQRIKGI